MDGHWEPHLSPLRDRIAAEFARVGAHGLAVAVVVGGRTVLHLWGSGPAAARPWDRDTLVCLFSAGKAAAAFAVLRLIEQGRLELDAPVARYWPEFGAHGKEATTVRQALAHQASIPALTAAPPATIHDRAALARGVEAEPPRWPPGTQGCFHSFTYGVIAGELVRRVTGCPFGDWFRTECAGLFDDGLAFTLTAAEQARCADVLLPPDNPLLAMMTAPGTALGDGWAAMDWRELNSACFRGADFPSIAGHGSALGLARLHGMLANDGVLDGRPVLRADLAQTMIAEHWHGPDPFMGAPVRMGLGVMLANAVFPFTGNPESFAQPGLGGVVGLGDSSLKLGIGITPGRLDAGLTNPFLDDLLAVMRRCL